MPTYSCVKSRHILATYLPFLIILSALLCLLPGRIKAEAEDSNQIKIAAILPLSGSLSSIGEYIRNGVELAYESLPTNDQRRVRLSFEDDQSKSAQAASAAQRLIAQEKVDALIVFGSGMGHVVAPIAERSRTVMVAVGASDHKVSAGREYVFTHWVTPDLEAEVMADEVVKRAYKTLAFVGSQQEGIQAIREATLKAFAKRGLSGKIVLDQSFLPDTTDFRNFIAAAKAKGVDGVITALFPQGLAAFAKQTKDLKLNAHLIGFETFEDESAVKAAAGSLEGHWYVNAAVSTAAFQQAFSKRFNRGPGLCSSNAYDAMNLLVTALKPRSTDHLAAASYLRTVQNFAGASGTYSATGDNRFTLPAEIKIIRANSFEPLYR